AAPLSLRVCAHSADPTATLLLPTRAGRRLPGAARCAFDTSPPLGLDPGHHRPELAANLFDQVVLLPLLEGPVHRPARLVLKHPLPGKAAGADFLEDAPHLAAGFLGDDALAGHEVAVLRGVADGVAHVRDAALVDEVDDELQLMQALEVRDLRLIARLHQRVETGPNELGDAAAEHHLLAKEVGFGLLLEGRLDDAGAGAADAASVGQGPLLGLAGGVLV